MFIAEVKALVCSVTEGIDGTKGSNFGGYEPMSICLIVFLAFPVVGIIAAIVVVAKDSIHNRRVRRSGNQGSFNSRAPSPLNVGLFTHDNRGWPRGGHT